MDPMMIGGLLLALLSMLVATLIDGNSVGPLVGPSSFVLVLFGTLGAGVMSYRKHDLGAMPKALVQAFTARSPEIDTIVTEMAELADVARRQGMLALEEKLGQLSEDALREGVQLLVDGFDAEQVRELIEIDIAAVDDRHQLSISFFKTLGGYSPTFGMIGTVIGLINMLQNLTDPAQLGIGMALALLTTFYGVLFANILWLPIATRLERLNDLELAAREVMLDGILSIQGGISPRLLVERLETYLPPGRRVGHQVRSNAAKRQEAA